MLLEKKDTAFHTFSKKKHNHIYYESYTNSCQFKYIFALFFQKLLQFLFGKRLEWFGDL